MLSGILESTKGETMDKDETPNSNNTAVLFAGRIEYSAEVVSVRIQDLIDALIDAQDNGCEFVVQQSGNSRGPKWQEVSADWTWMED